IPSRRTSFCAALFKKRSVRGGLESRSEFLEVCEFARKSERFWCQSAQSPARSTLTWRLSVQFVRPNTSAVVCLLTLAFALCRLPLPLPFAFCLLPFAFCLFYEGLRYPGPYSARPACAPVCWPPRTVTVPFTMTVLMPT